MFRVGQKIVCVDDKPRVNGMPAGRWINDALEEGRVYTVARYFMRAGVPTVHLVELRRGRLARAQHGNSVGYNADRFRPIVERKTDISVFEEILRRESAPLPLAEA